MKYTNTAYRATVQGVVYNQMHSLGNNYIGYLGAQTPHQAYQQANVYVSPTLRGHTGILTPRGTPKFGTPRVS